MAHMETEKTFFQKKVIKQSLSVFFRDIIGVFPINYGGKCCLIDFWCYLMLVLGQFVGLNFIPAVLI